MTTERVFNVNGDQLTLTQVRERNALVREAKQYGKETYTCCGALNSWELRIVQVNFAELKEIVKQIHFAREQSDIVAKINSTNRQAKRGNDGEQQA
jgi:hypothetical protein